MFVCLLGSQNGKVHVWNAENGTKTAVLESKHCESPMHCIQFNPKFMMLATAAQHMVGINTIVTFILQSSYEGRHLHWTAISKHSLCLWRICRAMFGLWDPPAFASIGCGFESHQSDLPVDFVHRTLESTEYTVLNIHQCKGKNKFYRPIFGFKIFS